MCRVLHIAGRAARVEAVQNQRAVAQCVADRGSDLGSFGHANQRTGDARRATFLGEGQHVQARLVLTIGVPLARAHFQLHGQDSITQRAGLRAVVIGRDPLGVSQFVCWSGQADHERYNQQGEGTHGRPRGTGNRSVAWH